MRDYQGLAAGIVEQAARDYLEVKRKIHFCTKHHLGCEVNGTYYMYPDAVTRLNGEISSLMNFFTSSRYHMLVPNIDSEYLIEHLDQKHEEDMTKKEYLQWERATLNRYAKRGTKGA